MMLDSITETLSHITVFNFLWYFFLLSIIRATSKKLFKRRKKSNDEKWITTQCLWTILKYFSRKLCIQAWKIHLIAEWISDKIKHNQWRKKSKTAVCRWPTFRILMLSSGSKCSMVECEISYSLHINDTMMTKDNATRVFITRDYE